MARLAAGGKGLWLGVVVVLAGAEAEVRKVLCMAGR